MPELDPAVEGRDVAEATEYHRALIDRLVQDGQIRSPAVEAAFRALPRHHFLPGLPLERVYRDEAIPTHERDGVPISSSSQPAAMAIMLEQLDVRPGHRVLEIGAGTGYNAALLATLVGITGRVVTVDLDQPIVEEARAHLAAAGVEGVEVVQGDGWEGYPPGAPYDRIELTVGVWDVAPAWVEQLAPGGRLLLPLWLRGVQLSVALERTTDESGQEHLSSVSASNCAFMRLRGPSAGPEAYLPLGPDAEFTLGVDDRARIDPDRVWALLNGPAWDIPLPKTGRSGFGLWLALREPSYCDLSADEASTTPVAGRLPVVAPGYRGTVGLLDDDALCLRVPGDSGDPAFGPDEAPPALLCFAGRRSTAEAVAERYLHHLETWVAAGRPSFEGVRLRIYPLIGADPSPPSVALVPKRWTRVAIDWP
jgi:protein-L-isoaspartate(D-aspartate) O-methyltransferase